MTIGRHVGVVLLGAAAAVATWSTAPLRAEPTAATQPASKPAGTDVDITFRTDQAPDLKDWCEQTLKPVLVQWYPKVVAQLPIDGHEPPAHFDVWFDPKYKGVAETGGVHVRANPTWIRENLKGESVGALLHEMVHVVQQPYHTRRRGSKYMPTWLLEGTCDYIRWFEFEPNHPNPHVDPRHNYHYDDSYRTSATFLKYVVEHYDKNFLAEANAANYMGQYSPDLWTAHTGKTAEQLGSEWEKSIGGTGEKHAPATGPVWNRPPATRGAATSRAAAGR